MERQIRKLQNHGAEKDIENPPPKLQSKIVISPLSHHVYGSSPRSANFQKSTFTRGGVPFIGQYPMNHRADRRSASSTSPYAWSHSTKHKKEYEEEKKESRNPVTKSPIPPSTPPNSPKHGNSPASSESSTITVINREVSVSVPFEENFPQLSPPGGFPPEAILPTDALLPGTNPEDITDYNRQDDLHTPTYQLDCDLPELFKNTD